MSDKRLLIVDDQPALGEIVRRTAAGLGYDVKVTTHAEEFMAVFDDFNPTAIVLDIVMPDIDGIELVAWLVDKGVRRPYPCGIRLQQALRQNGRNAWGRQGAGDRVPGKALQDCRTTRGA